eukprot:6174719-Alexandrium_andersonii.AAC.1
MKGSPRTATRPQPDRMSRELFLALQALLHGVRCSDRTCDHNDLGQLAILGRHQRDTIRGSTNACNAFSTL